MRVGRPSRTAEQNAAFRAAESRRPPGVRQLNDPYAALLLPTGLRILVWASSVPIVGGGLYWFVETRWPGARSSIIARTRLIDDWLSDAMGAGVEQVVLLGAGFDSRAWRLAALADARVFEVGHPATSAAKRSRLGVSVPTYHMCASSRLTLITKCRRSILYRQGSIRPKDRSWFGTQLQAICSPRRLTR